MEFEVQSGMNLMADGAKRTARAEAYGALVTDSWLGKYATAVRRGMGFSYSSLVTWAALTTTNQFMIINPPGSGKIFIPARIILGYSSVTNVAGYIGMYQFPVNSIIGTAASVVSFTAGLTYNLLSGAGNASKMIFSPTTNVIVGTPTLLRPIVSLAAMAATTAIAPFVTEVDFEGLVQFVPGTAMILAGNAANAMISMTTILGFEVPMPIGQM
jgi:hypothetical protein